MTATETIEALWRQLEVEPDATTKLALSDLYREQDQLWMSHAVQWCVQRLRWPRKRTQWSGDEYYDWDHGKHNLTPKKVTAVTPLYKPMQFVEWEYRRKVSWDDNYKFFNSLAGQVGLVAFEMETAAKLRGLTIPS